MTITSVVSPLVHDPHAPSMRVEQLVHAIRLSSELARFETVGFAELGALLGNAQLRDVLTITGEMFSCEPELERMFDSEDAEHPFVVLTVKARGEAKELVERSLEWHERVSRAVSGNFGLLRLSLIPT